MLTPARETYKDSPNRYQPTATQTPEELIENYVSKIAGMNVDFSDANEEDSSLMMTLNVEEFAPLTHSNEMMVATYRQSFAEVIKRIKSDLAAGGHTSSKIEESAFEVTPGMYRSAGMQTVFHIKGVYTLYK